MPNAECRRLTGRSLSPPTSWCQQGRHSPGVHPQSENFQVKVKRVFVMMNACEKPRQIVVQEKYGYEIIQRTGFDLISVLFLKHNLARFFTRIHHHELPGKSKTGVRDDECV